MAHKLTEGGEPEEHRSGVWCKDLHCSKCYSADTWQKSEVDSLRQQLAEANQRAVETLERLHNLRRGHGQALSDVEDLTDANGKLHSELIRLRSDLSRLRADAKDARGKAMEEAAKVCEARGNQYAMIRGADAKAYASDECAAAIRSHAALDAEGRGGKEGGG